MISNKGKKGLTVPLSVRFSEEESQSLHAFADAFFDGNVSYAVRLAVRAYIAQKPLLALGDKIQQLILTLKRYCRFLRDDREADTSESYRLDVSRIESAIHELTALNNRTI